MGLFDRWKKKEEAITEEVLPKGIVKVERGYQVEGRISVHLSLEKAVKQLEGIKNAE